MFWAAVGAQVQDTQGLVRTFVQGCGQNWAFRNADWEYPPNKSGNRDIVEIGTFCVLPSGNLTYLYTCIENCPFIFDLPNLKMVIFQLS